MKSDYTNEEFERGVREVISRYFIREDYCPVCKTETNIIKVVDCEDYWRCLSCNTLVERCFKERIEKTLPGIYAKEHKSWHSVSNDIAAPDSCLEAHPVANKDTDTLEHGT